jgi:CrcB protein
MHPTLFQYLAIAAAGAFGAVSRFWVALACERAFGRGFPAATLFVNLTGTFFLGFFIAALPSRSDTLRLALATGFLGAYTTFSTFMYESNALLHGHPIKAILNLFGSILLGLLAIRLGLQLGR